MKVELQPDDDLVAARGRPCWTSFCAASVVLLSVATFLFTLTVLTKVGKSQDAAPDQGSADDHVGMRHPAKHPGERSYEAGQGVAMSVALMGFLIFRRRQAYSVRISSGLLAQFAIRGATLSCLIASFLEISGIWTLRHLTGLSNHALLPSSPGDASGASIAFVALTMMLVGVSEEFAKASVVLLGTWLSAGAMRLASPNWFQRLWQVLVESPRSLMLAGLAAGCGFMTVENVGYLMSAGLMYDKDDSAAAERFMRCVIVAVRVGLNLHPWLAGITCARIAQVSFAQGRETPALSLKEFAWALLPAAAAHAAFDFGLVCMPGILAIFMPPVVWYAAKTAFDNEWDKFESSTHDRDPSEEVSSQLPG